MRDLEKMASKAADVLVIGGGIHGATVAFHAARAGFRTGIIDKQDFGSATSANSLKILHGGLRYLQHANIRRMRQSILSRREMMCLAPHLVSPLPCIMPIYGGGIRGKTAMQTALHLNDFIGRDRNKGLPAEIRLPKGQILSKEKCRETVPGVETRGLKGALLWYDVLALNTERLVLEYILQSGEFGAMAANYAEAAEIRKEGEGMFAVLVRDILTEKTYAVKAKCIVNATGPWLENVLVGGKEAGPAVQKWAMALNLVVKKRLFNDCAVALEGLSGFVDKNAVIKRKKRLYFFVPWRGYTMIGTYYRESKAHPDSWKVSSQDIQNMIDDINAIYPAAQLRYEDITFYHAGLLPVSRHAEGDNAGVQLAKKSSLEEGPAGLVTIRGVKYTTAPYIAAEVVRFLKQRCQPSGKAENRLPCAESMRQHPEDDAIIELLKERYGGRWNRVADYLPARRSDDIWVDKKMKLLKGEVRYLIAEEMACRLSDIVMRRTGLGTAECLPGRNLNRLAAYMAEILGWDEARREKEINDVRQHYAPLHITEQ